MLLHDQSHPIPTIPFSLQRGNYSLMDGETLLVDGEASVVMAAMISSNSPSRRSARTETSGSRDGVSRRWRRTGCLLAISSYPPCVFSSKALSSPKEGVGGRPRGPHARAARPLLGCAALGCGALGPPPDLPFWLRESSGKIGPFA